MGGSFLRALLCVAVVVSAPAAAGGCSPSPEGAATAGDVATTDAEPPSNATAGPGLFSGERLVAEISSHGITAGEVELSVGVPCAAAGRAVIPVQSWAERIGIVRAFAPQRGELISWLDARSGHPLRTRTIIDSTKSLSDTSVTYDRGGYRYHWKRTLKDPNKKKRPPTTKARLTPPGQPLHDLHSTMGVLRNWRAEVGGRATLFAVIKRRLWRVEVTVAERESVTVGGSTFDAVRIDGVGRKLDKKLKPLKRSRRFSLWISDDEHRVPVRALLETRKLGMVELQLADYEQRELDWPRRLSPCDKRHAETTIRPAGRIVKLAVSGVTY